MLKNFTELLNLAQKSEPVPLTVAVAEDREVLSALKSAQDKGLVKPILTGMAAAIEPLAQEIGLSDCEIYDCANETEAALTAVRLVSSGRAKAVMKGLINTSPFMRAVLDKQVGLRTERRLSHLAAMEQRGAERLVFISDGAINPAPDLEAKKEILVNALDILWALGYQCPKVAAIAANEQVNEKIPATVDAKNLLEYSREQQLNCLIEGPVALDVALSAQAAQHKGIDSRIAGQVDLFLAPNIEAGNVMIKGLLHWGPAAMAGMVIGTCAPVVLTSRSDSAEGKVLSIALAAAAAQAGAR